MTNEQYADLVLTAMSDALGNADLNLASIPMRRHDEQGWKIGEVYQGLTLTRQLTFSDTPEGIAATVNDHAAKLVERIAFFGATLSARPPSVSQAWTETFYAQTHGVILRIICMEQPYQAVRCDVVVG